jgi:hypothetical protein
MRVLLLLLACGSEPAPAEPFLGTWSFASGTNNVVCPSGTTSQALQGNITVEKSGNGLQVIDAAGCNFRYALAGAEATLGGDKSCSFAVGQGVTADVTYDAITLSTRDGRSMSDVFNGKVRYTSAAGSEDCAFSGTATLTKL